MDNARRMFRSRGRGHCALGRLSACAVLFSGAVVMLGGCGAPAYDGTVLQEVAARGQAHDWNESRPLLKEHLLKYPNDPVGHFYYGLSYLHLPNPSLTLAEGELLTAQALLAKEPELPEGATDMDYATFMGVLHQRTALVYLRAFREALRMKVPYDYPRTLLLKASAEVEKGLDADPDSSGLQEYAEFLRESLRGAPESVPEVLTRAAGTGSPV